MVELCWFIPPREQWDEYKKGNVTECAEVIWSIDMFVNHREQLELPFEDDISEERAKSIWIDIARAKDEERRMKKLYSTQDSSEASLTSYWKF